MSPVIFFFNQDNILFSIFGYCFIIISNPSLLLLFFKGSYFYDSPFILMCHSICNMTYYVILFYLLYIFFQIDCCIKLSGMPDLSLSFVNPRVFDDVSFHPCVRFRRWEVNFHSLHIWLTLLFILSFIGYVDRLSV